MYMPPFVSSTSLLESQRNDDNAMAVKESGSFSETDSYQKECGSFSETDSYLAQWFFVTGKEGVERAAPLPM